MSGEKALTKDMVEECWHVKHIYNETLRRMNDMYHERLGYITTTIAKHSGNQDLISASPYFAEFLQHVKPDGIIYYSWYNISKQKAHSASFRVKLEREYDLVCVFPTSWVFNDSFEEELIEGRKRYLELNENMLIKAIKEKLTSEELAILHKVK